MKGVYSWGILLFDGYRLLRLRCEAETVQGCSRETRPGCGRAPEGSRMSALLGRGLRCRLAQHEPLNPESPNLKPPNPKSLHLKPLNPKTSKFDLQP